MPWGYWIPRAFAGVDVRRAGSGNIGGTNVFRVLGARYGVAVTLLDLGKGLAAALVGRLVGGDVVGVLAGVAAVAGHWRPLFLRFARGGKMVATTGGVGFALAPLATLAAVGVWWAVFLPTRYASVASMSAAAALPLLAYALGASWPVVGFTAGAAVAIVLLHRSNIRRLAAGTENRIDLRRRSRARSLRREASL